MVIGLFQYGEGALFDGRYMTSVSQLQYDGVITPLVCVATDPYESDQSELSLTLLRTTIVRGGGKISDAHT